MAVIHLTDSAIRELGVPERRIEYHDDVVTGLILRLTPNGHTPWRYRYRSGRRGRLNLGGFPSLLIADARRVARDAQREVALGKDPAREKQARAQALTFNELADLYLERYAKPKKRSW